MLDHISPILLLITIIVVTMLVFFGLYKTLSLFVPWAEVRWGVLFLVALSLLQLVYHFATTTRAEDIAIVFSRIPNSSMSSAIIFKTTP